MAELNNTMAEMLAALQNPNPASDTAIRKSWTQASGLTNYDLERPALALYPFIGAMTMLRNETPRVAGNGDVAVHWKAITSINPGNIGIGISEGARGALMAETLVPFLATYVPFGLENSVTFEAERAAEGFDDVRARASLNNLRAFMIAEEQHILFGNANHQLQITPDPVVSVTTTGGSIADGTYLVGCVALTHQGLQYSSVSLTGVPSQITKVNTDGTNDVLNAGAAQKNATPTSTGAISATNHNIISGHVTPVEGAAGYAWYIGTAGNMFLQKITNVANFSVSSLVTNTQNFTAAPASDYSADSNFDYNGLLHFAQSSLNATVLALANGVDGTGTKLTSDGAGGCSQISQVCKTMFDKYRLGPQEILVSSTEAEALNSMIIANGGAPIMRMNGDLNNTSQWTGYSSGMMVGALLNKFTNQMMRLRVHPFLTPGTILLYAREIPYPLSGVGNVFQIRTRRDYYQIDWPLRTRKWEFGTYCDSVLQHYAPFAMGVIHNIAS